MRKLPNPSRLSSCDILSTHITGKPTSSLPSLYMSVHDQLSHHILVGIKGSSGEDNTDIFENSAQI